ncbi:MAG: hypothetical protein PV362_04170 [Providencia heimbachae]|nr:hypothetical protein [Providencia heimbachae]
MHVLPAFYPATFTIKRAPVANAVSSLISKGWHSVLRVGPGRFADTN